MGVCGWTDGGSDTFSRWSSGASGVRMREEGGKGGVLLPRYARTSEACSGSIVNATPVGAGELCSVYMEGWNVPQTTSS
jgi:hypothetical protein